MDETPQTPNEPPSTPPPYNAAPAAAHASGLSAEERQWAMFAHLAALAGGLVTAGWAASLGCFLGPLVVWLVKRETMPFVDDQGKEALNFNITVAIVFLGLAVLSVVTFGIGLIIAVPAWIVIGIGWLVLTIIAAIKANEGVAYRYPFTLRLVK